MFHFGDRESPDRAHFLLGVSDAESASQPDELETSNSGASALGAAGLGLLAGEARGFVDAFGAAAAAAAFAGGETPGFAGVAVVAAGLEAKDFTGDAGVAAGLAAPADFAFASPSGALPRPSACSTEALRSTSIRNGDPEEYSA